jgi:hypothetical protein
MPVPIVRHTSNFFDCKGDGYNELGYNQSGADRSGYKPVVLKWSTPEDVLAFDHADDKRLLDHAKRWLGQCNIDSTKLQKILINSRDDNEYRNGIVISYILILASDANAGFLLNMDKPPFYWLNAPPIPPPPYNPGPNDLLKLDQYLKILKNFQDPKLDLQSPWMWLKDLIWAVADGRGFSPTYWRTSRITALNISRAGGVGATTSAVEQSLQKSTDIVNAELDWFSKLIGAKDYAEACSWMAVRKNVNVYVPEKQYKYGIPMRNVSRITGKVAIPQNNASFINYLADAQKAGQIQNVQLRADNDLSTIQPGVWYLSF